MSPIALQRLFLVSLLFAPVTVAGLVFEPFIISTLLTPPKGYAVSEHIQHPRTARNHIDRAYYLLRIARRDPNSLKGALRAANTAVILDSDNGDTFVCRAYVNSALQHQDSAIADVLLAKSKYLRAGNLKEAQNVDTIYLRQIRGQSPLISTAP